METSSLDCKLAGKCGGCPLGARDFAPEKKTEVVRNFFPNAVVQYSPRDRVRDRADLIWENVAGEMRLGLYGLDSRQVVDLPACPMMSEALESWFKDFRQKAPPIRKGSVRLRVSPQGERGVWLDFANQDVKTLFEEKNYLAWLSSKAFVEIGQRRKALVMRDGLPKLTDPTLRPWFESYDAAFNPISLYGPVGGFSQVGFAANRALVTAVCELVTQSGCREWLELFCGNGNFALALASRGLQVEAVELEALAVEGLKLSLEKTALPMQLHTQDVYLKSGSLPSFAGRGLLVDPPRAGLRELLGQLRKGVLPQALVYVSCFEESFVKDCAELKELGLAMVNLLGVDQFPFSRHMEWVALFK